MGGGLVTVTSEAHSQSLTMACLVTHMMGCEQDIVCVQAGGDVFQRATCRWSQQWWDPAKAPSVLSPFAVLPFTNSGNDVLHLFN